LGIARKRGTTWENAIWEKKGVGTIKRIEKFFV